MRVFPLRRFAATISASRPATGVSGGPRCAESPAAYTTGLETLCSQSLRRSRPCSSTAIPAASSSRDCSAGRRPAACTTRSASSAVETPRDEYRTANPCSPRSMASTGARVEAIERGEQGLAVRYSSRGVSTALEADLVVHAAGRRPALQSMALEAAGIAVDEHGRLRLNDWLQSVSNPAVYAAGDSAQRGPPLTPVAGRDAEIVAANLLGGNTRIARYHAVPTVAFTIPPIAAVGLDEGAAREACPRVRVRCARASEWYTARRLAEPVYGFKVLIDVTNRHILGAHLVGPAAEDTINLFALAIRENLSADALRHALFAYPTAASDIGYML